MERTRQLIDTIQERTDLSLSLVPEEILRDAPRFEKKTLKDTEAVFMRICRHIAAAKSRIESTVIWWIAFVEEMVVTARMICAEADVRKIFAVE